jgi:hypothetical protein
MNYSMSKSWRLTLASLSIFSLSFGATAADNGLQRGHLYSTAAVNKFCSNAQQIIAGTEIVSTNIIHSDYNAFVESKALPFEVASEPDAALAPVTTQQYVTYGYYDSGKDYPQLISCKMKSADAIQYFLGAEAASAESTCKAINQDTLDRVATSLTQSEQRSIVLDDDEEVIVDPDNEVMFGFQWVTPFDPVYIGDDGELHVVSKSLLVSKFAYLPPIPGLDDRFRGVHYCHLLAPEYARSILTGEVQP